MAPISDRELRRKAEAARRHVERLTGKSVKRRDPGPISDEELRDPVKAATGYEMDGEKISCEELLAKAKRLFD